MHFCERQVTTMNSNPLVDYDKVKQLIKQAGEIIIAESSNLTIYTKGKADFVTQADLRVQNFLKDSLYELYPEIDFMGEEEVASIGDGNPYWILDPIDGTTNYIYQYHHSAISLALKDTSGIAFGVIYNPFTNELFSAIRGEGSYLNDTPIKVNNTVSLDSALVSVGTSPYHKEMAHSVFRKIEKVYQRALDIRRTGSAALDLAYVACGRQDAYFEYALKPWDYAAGNLILAEAGGIVQSIDNKFISYVQPSSIVACSSKDLMQEIITILKEDSNSV